MNDIALISQNFPGLDSPRGPRVVMLNDNLSTLRGALSVSKAGSKSQVAVLRINGPISYQFSWGMTPSVWMSDLITTVDELTADATVSAVILDLNSPGGDASGMAEVMSHLHSLAAVKPLYAIANDGAMSGSYWMATAARELVATRTALIGSIGVAMMYKDMSAAYAQMGIRMVPISTGKAKTIGAPGTAIDAAGIAQLQEIAADTAAPFLADVAAFTKLSIEQIASLEAAIFVGEKAVAKGLANRITTLSAYVAQIVKSTEEPSMSTPNTPTASTTPAAPTAAASQPPAPAAKVAATPDQLNEIYGDDASAKYTALTSGLSKEEALADCNKRLKATVNAQSEALEAAKKAAASAGVTAPAPENKTQAAAPKAGADPIPNVQPRVQGAAAGKDPYIAKMEALAKDQKAHVGAVMAAYAKEHPDEHQEYLNRIGGL